MEFDEYQERCNETDQQLKKGEDGLLIPLLGLAGETGTLLSEYKKKVRDGNIYEDFHKCAEEELGDILWYLSNVASRLNLSLEKIATKNILKTQERWPIDHKKGKYRNFDDEYPLGEQLPRKATIRIYQDSDTKIARIEMIEDKCLILGDRLTDNSYKDDGYRFHDIFHLAHWAVLGWSPVMRKLLSCKRKSRPDVDEIEDGARAALIEELIVAFVYNEATRYSLYKGAKHVSSEMLSTIKKLVNHLEVHERLTSDWESAILQGYKIFREINDKKDIKVAINMSKKSIEIV